MFSPYLVNYSMYGSDEIRTITILAHSQCHAVNLLYQYYSSIGYDLNAVSLKHFSCESLAFISPKVISDIKFNTISHD